MKIFLFALSVLFCNLLYSQAEGGAERGENTPTVSKPENLDVNSSSGNVNLFKGTYSHQIKVGTVQTPSGISFTLNSSCNSSNVTSPVMVSESSYPYGESWNLSLPYIRFIYGDLKRKYSEEYYKNEVDKYFSTIRSIGNHAYTNQISSNIEYCEEDLRKEFSSDITGIHLNIPGVYSGEMVFKYLNKNSKLVFVPKLMETYIELEFGSENPNSINQTIGLEATVKLNDGTLYNFRGLDFSFKNPTNQLYNGPNINLTDLAIQPLKEIRGIRINEISNPNIANLEKIVFEYELYGKMNYFKEFEQFDGINQNYTEYKDAILKKIYSTNDYLIPYQSLELEYEVDKNYMINFNPQSSVKLDSFYVSKTIWATSSNYEEYNHTSPIINNSNHFSKWSDWLEIKHGAMSTINTSWYNNMHNWAKSNPYIFYMNGSWGYEAQKFPLGTYEGKINHCYLEKSNINPSIFKKGRTYEIKTFMKDLPMGGELYDFSTIDINLIYSETGHNKVNGWNALPVNSMAKQGTIFSTFDRPLKWRSNYGQYTYRDNNNKTSSNYFVFPHKIKDLENIPNLILQIGPGNSDNDFNVPFCDPMMQTNGFMSTYHGFDYKNSLNLYKCKTSCQPCKDIFVPRNFGVGIPWEMTKVYNFGFISDDYKDYGAYYKFGAWTSNPLGMVNCIWPFINIPQKNVPTRAEDIIVDRIEINEIEKMPLMLKKVNFYKFNNAIIPFEMVDNKDYYGKIMNKELCKISSLNFYYDVMSLNLYDSLFAAKNSVASKTVEKYVLSKYEIEANGEKNTLDSFGYSRVKSDNYLDTTKDYINDNFQNEIICLSKIINNTGRVKEIFYKPIVMWKKTGPHFYRDILFILSNKSESKTMQFEASVDSIVEYSASQSINHLKSTKYIYGDITKSYDFFTKEVDFGYKDVMVLHPIEPNTGKRRKEKYFFYNCGIINPYPNYNFQIEKLSFLQGKIEKHFDFDRAINTYYDYNYVLAYKNGVNREINNDANERYKDEGGDIATNKVSPIVSVQNALYTPRLIKYNANANNHSYFVYLEKKRTADIGYSNGNWVNYFEEYEYYTSLYKGECNTEGHIIIDSSCNPNYKKIKYEPSWNLYKTTSYNSTNPNLKMVVENFYLYNFLNYSKKGISSVLDFVHVFNLRNLLSEVRTSFVNEYKGVTTRKSQYFKYKNIPWSHPRYSFSSNWEDYEGEYMVDSRLDGFVPYWSVVDNKMITKADLIKKYNDRRATLPSLSGEEGFDPCREYTEEEKIEYEEELERRRLEELYKREKGNCIEVPDSTKPYFAKLGKVDLSRWNRSQQYFYTGSKGLCVKRYFNATVFAWFECPCTRTEQFNLFIGKNDIVKWKIKRGDLKLYTLGGNQDIIRHIGSYNTNSNTQPLDGRSPGDIIPKLNVVSTIHAKSFENLSSGALSVAPNAIYENKINALLSTVNTQAPVIIVSPSEKLLVVKNESVLTEYEGYNNSIYFESKSFGKFTKISADYLRLKNEYPDYGLVTFDSWVDNYESNIRTEIDQMPETNGQGEGEEEPRMPNNGVAMNYKVRKVADYEKIDDIVINENCAGKIENKNHVQYLINDSFYIPFHAIMKKEYFWRCTKEGTIVLDKTKNAAGLYTKYYFEDTVAFVNYCDSKTCNDISGAPYISNECIMARKYTNFMLPTRITVGYDRPDSMGTNFVYYTNTQLHQTLKDNGEISMYEYDALGRPTKQYLNGILRNEYNYNIWDRTLLANADAITNQNYIQSKTYFNAVSKDGTIARKFFDPMGRTDATAMVADNDISMIKPQYSNIIYSGEKVLDWEDKVIETYKPFEIMNNSTLTVVKNTSNPSTPQATQHMEYNMKGELIRMTDYGVSPMAAQATTSNRTLETSSYMQSELGLNLAEASELNLSQNTLAYRQETKDPDGKTSVSYTWANGKKAADAVLMPNSAPLKTLYYYDNKWDLRKVKDPSNKITTYLSNLQGLVFEKITPDNYQTKYYYNEEGNVVAIQDNLLRSESQATCRIFTYDHFGRQLLQLKGEIDLSKLCPGCTNGNSAPAGDHNPNEFYRPQKPELLLQNLAGYHFDVIIPTNPITEIKNTYGQSYYWLPNQNILKDSIGGVRTIFDSIKNTVVEKIWVYNDLDDKYISTTERSPNHNTLYLTKKAEIQSKIDANFVADIANKKLYSLGQLSASGSFNEKGILHEVQANTYTSEMLPFESYTYAKFFTHPEKRFIHRVNSYNLLGKPLETTFEELNAGVRTPKLAYKMQYNNYGGLSMIQWHNGNGKFTPLEAYNYDAATSKMTSMYHYANSPMTIEAYLYDERERLKKIDNPYFEEELYYDNQFPTTASQANYNGNINAVRTRFKASSASPQSSQYQSPLDYYYTYDAANRLESALSSLSYGHQNYSYQPNGNINSYNSTDIVNNAPVFNQHFYHYLGGNRIGSITSNGNETLDPLLPIQSNNRTFGYDVNGNVNKDTLRQLQLAYGRGNLPYITAKNTQRTYYAYNTADSRIFKGDSQQGLYYMSGTGVLDLATNQWEYYPTAHTQIKNGIPYFLSLDHLGNTRAVVARNIIEAQYDYYPYGKILRKWENIGSRYLSTKHEKDKETGYDDRKARWYDEDALSFLSVDPLASKFPSWSPYNFVFNNPLRFVDPDGRAPYDWIKNKETNQIEWRGEVTSSETTPDGYDYIGKVYNGLSILTYIAHSIEGVGVEIKAGYNDGKEGDVDARWVQTINTNVSLNGATSPYNDPQPSDDDKPFYWTDAELPSYKNVDGQDLIFYDRPTRNGSTDGTSWQGELSLVVSNGDGYKPVITITYGFETKTGSANLSRILVTTPSDFQNKTINDYNKTLPSSIGPTKADGSF
jgi:RHS repeat-associated protein